MLPPEQYGGINPTHAVAGFGGALASLPFLKPGSKLAILGSIVAGLMTAMFLTPVVSEILESQRFLGIKMSERAELGLAFLLGLIAMILIPTILAAVTWIRDNVAKVMEKLTGVKPRGPDDPA